MIEIDGSMGEGGGQVLRTAISLAMVLGQPFRIRNIRAGRRKPGLLRQHFTAITAAQEICGARVEGAQLGSGQLEFRPGAVRSGDYRFAIGSAGSTTLVLQTILWPLLLAEGPSRLAVEGGTHNPAAPSFEFLARAFAPRLAQLGAPLDLQLDRAGYYPAGGGQVTATIAGGATLRPCTFLTRGEVTQLHAHAIVSELPPRIADRELQVAKTELGLRRPALQREVRPSSGPGNVFQLYASGEWGSEVFTGFGVHGVRAEQVAKRTCEDFERWRDAEVPIGLHLADQLLIPMALAGGGSFTTLSPSLHTQTNALIVERFTGHKVRFDELGPDRVRVEVGSAVL